MARMRPPVFMERPQDPYDPLGRLPTNIALKKAAAVGTPPSLGHGWMIGGFSHRSAAFAGSTRDKLSHRAGRFSTRLVFGRLDDCCQRINFTVISNHAGGKLAIWHAI